MLEDPVGHCGGAAEFLKHVHFSFLVLISMLRKTVSSLNTSSSSFQFSEAFK